MEKEGKEGVRLFRMSLTCRPITIENMLSDKCVACMMRVGFQETPGNLVQEFLDKSTIPRSFCEYSSIDLDSKTTYYRLQVVQYKPFTILLKQQILARFLC